MHSRLDPGHDAAHCPEALPWSVFVVTLIMPVSFDPAKRFRTLAERGLDFRDAEIVFDDRTVEIEDTRRNYSERRIICYGFLAGRMVVVGYTPRGEVRHVFSMRKANAREKARLAPYFAIESRES